MDIQHKGTEYYVNQSYLKKERFINYWYVLDAVRSFVPQSVLEIGVGNGVVTSILKTFVPHVETVDIDPTLSPDIVGSVENIPLTDKQFDVAIADEVLEHLPFEKFEQSLGEIERVVNKGAVISLPHYGMTFSFTFKLPLFKKQAFVWKIPYFWKTKPLSSEHQWEIGIKGYSLSRIESAIENVGFTVKRRFVGHDDPYRMIFVLNIKH